jgi:diaminopimelate decarboxylase
VSWVIPRERSDRIRLVRAWSLSGTGPAGRIGAMLQAGPSPRDIAEDPVVQTSAALPGLLQADETLPGPGPWPLTARAAGPDGLASVGDVPLRQLAAEYGTPAIVVDERDLRQRARDYRAAFGDGAVAYAAEAFLCRFMVRCAEEEGLALGVRSAGELAVAASAGFPASRIIVRGQAKTPEDVRAALDQRAGRIVIESLGEIPRLAAQVPGRQQVLLRVSPALDAAEAARRVLAQPALDLAGLSCDLTAAPTTAEEYVFAARGLVDVLAAVRDEHGRTLNELNLAGDPADGGAGLTAVAGRIRATVAGACRTLRLPVPRITVELGQAIVARASITLYRVVTITHQPDGRVLVAVDGGVSDHPKPVPVAAPVRMVGHPAGSAAPAVTVVGRTGAVLATDAILPATLRLGDLLVTAGTGAGQHAMASNYTMVGRPPVVAVHGGRARLLVRRETHADLRVRDVGL